ERRGRARGRLRRARTPWRGAASCRPLPARSQRLAPRAWFPGGSEPPGVKRRPTTGPRRGPARDRNDLGRALSSVQSLDDVSRLAVQILLETTPAARGAGFLLEEDGKTLRPAMVCVRDGADRAPVPGVL